MWKKYSTFSIPFLFFNAIAIRIYFHKNIICLQQINWIANFIEEEQNHYQTKKIDIYLSERAL